MANWPLTEERKRAFVVVNESAGGVGPGAREALTEILTEAGFQSLDIREEVHKLQECRELAAKANVIVVLGGDGTARAAAEAFADGPPMIILPGGTLNVLPHALYGDRTWPDALRDALAGGRVKRLVCGAANGTRFFVAALFGAPTLLATAREAVREGKLLTAAKRFQGGTLCTRLRGDPQGFNVITVSGGDIRIERYGIEGGAPNLRAVRAVKMSGGRLIVDEAAPAPLETVV